MGATLFAVIVLLFLGWLLIEFGRKLLGALAVLANALVQHVSDLDGHAPSTVLAPVGGEARSVANSAIDVFHPSTTDADGMVVVIRHPRFVQRGRVGRFKPTQHVEVGKIPQNHVDGLGRQLRKVIPGGCKDIFGGGVGVAFDGGQHGEALFGHPAPVGTQGLCPCFVVATGIAHGTIETLIMTESQ
jgi:hypothetical protein